MSLWETLFKEGLLGAIINLEASRDSLEIGSPSKGGKIEIKFNALNLEEARTKLANANIIRNEAQSLIGYDPTATTKKGKEDD